jgi:hypothetical protein
MATFEEKVEKMCQNLETPGVILVGGTADGTFPPSTALFLLLTNHTPGSFKYEKAIGQRSLKDPSKYDPLSIDATMWLASCTKLMTTVAAMQCVEKGQFGLDDNVTKLLPELKGRKILTGFEEGSGKPILVENTKVITLRYAHLLNTLVWVSTNTQQTSPNPPKRPRLRRFQFVLLFLQNHLYAKRNT